jgi:hypothetical protein
VLLADSKLLVRNSACKNPIFLIPLAWIDLETTDIWKGRFKFIYFYSAGAWMIRGEILRGCYYVDRYLWFTTRNCKLYWQDLFLHQFKDLDVCNCLDYVRRLLPVDTCYFGCLCRLLGLDLIHDSDATHAGWCLTARPLTASRARLPGFWSWGLHGVS